MRGALLAIAMALTACSTAHASGDCTPGEDCAEDIVTGWENQLQCAGLLPTVPTWRAFCDYAREHNIRPFGPAFKVWIDTHPEWVGVGIDPKWDGVE